jgi:hypothetical protein
MVTVIPAKIKVEIKETNTESDSNVPKSADYFFDKLIKDKPSDFEKIELSKDAIEGITTIIDKETEILRSKLTEAFNSFPIPPTLLPTSENWINNLRLLSTNDLFIYNSKPKILIYSKNNGEFVMVGRTASSIDSVVSSFNEEFRQINNISHDFGLTFGGIITGKEFAEQNLRSFVDAGSLSYKEQKNPFETQVIQDISKITTCMLSNVGLTFTKTSETYEYDILIPLEANTIINIEATDYSSAKQDVIDNKSSLKKDLILSTMDKVTRVKAESIIVSKGFPPNPFEQMKSIASFRNITFLDEKDYYNTIEEIIFRKAIPLKNSPYTFPVFGKTGYVPILDNLMRYFKV